MSERELARSPSPAELSCLKYLSNHPEAELSQFDVAVVERLVSYGLMDRFLLVAFPVMPQVARYRLTEKGRFVLYLAMKDE